MTFDELYGEKLTRELGSADTSELFTTARRKAAVNEAMLEFVKQTECYTKQVNVTLSDGTQEYDLDSTGILSDGDFLWIAAQGAEHKFTDANGNITYTDGDDFPRKDIPEMQEEQIKWRDTTTATNLPSSYYIREHQGSVYLGIVPVPDIGGSESALVILPYVAIPTTMAEDNDEPFAHITVVGETRTVAPKRTLRPWHQALVHYAAALLEPLRKNYAGEQRQRTLFAGMVADYLQKNRKKGGHHVKLARNYYRQARGRIFSSRLDPRIYP